MQKIHLEQKLVSKLSGHQIQFIKLLQVPTLALNAYISKEIAENPLLDEEKTIENEAPSEPNRDHTTDLQPSLGHYPTDFTKKMHAADRLSMRENGIPAIASLQEKLREQLHLLRLNEVEFLIGEQLIGSLNEDGYLQCELEIIAQDLHVFHYIETSLETIETVLTAIQSLDPPGIAARNLQECLLIQLNNQNQDDPVVQLAKQIVSSCFEAFTRKHYEAIVKKLHLPDTRMLKTAWEHILRLNPKPGRHVDGTETSDHFLTPDFLIVEKQGTLSVELLYYPTYKPRLNNKYLSLLKTYAHKTHLHAEDQEMVAFLKKKLEDAKWFIEALSQRNQTLLKTMEAILALQYRFFAEGEEVDWLRPMILQQVADKIGMDASTVSRIVNQKSVQGRFGIYPLKFFFSEGISQSTGETVSNKAVKSRIETLIDKEDKKRPYTDEQLVAHLSQEGYQVARRTVAKYREQLNLPVARLRKTFV
jgi:RNA polymerase sigma-54 factor